MLVYRLLECLNFVNWGHILVKLASYYHSGTSNFKMISRFLKTLCIPECDNIIFSW
jgi:hypothetical protein